MKIGLIHPRSGNPAKANLIWPPLGLCRIAKFMTDHGHEVKIIEDALNNYEPDYIAAENARFDFVGIGAMTLQIPRVQEIISSIKKMSQAVVVCGGPHYSAIQELPPDCDALVVGDGEQAFLDIVNGRRGIVFGRQLEEYIDVDFSFIDYPRYGDHLIDGTRAISLLTSRGCPFDCRFCGSPKMFGRKVTDYPLEIVVANMKRLSSKYNINAFRIMDDTFTVSKERVAKFCDLVASMNWRMSCLTNVRTIDLETLKKMKAAGFEFVAIGAESADPTVLGLANKRQTKEDIRNAVEKINEAGLKAELLFMIGLPGETEKSLTDTIKFASGLEVFRTHAQFFTPFPGCEFHSDIEKYGQIIDDDYQKWNHRLPVFVPHSISYESLAGLAEQFFLMIGRKIGS